MRGILKIIALIKKRDVILFSITSPYSLKVVTGFFDRQLIAHVGNHHERRQQKRGQKLLKWIDNSIDYYLSHSEFRETLEDLFSSAAKKVW